MGRNAVGRARYPACGGEGGGQAAVGYQLPPLPPDLWERTAGLELTAVRRGCVRGCGVLQAPAEVITEQGGGDAVISEPVPATEDATSKRPLPTDGTSGSPEAKRHAGEPVGAARCPQSKSSRDGRWGS